MARSFRITPGAPAATSYDVEASADGLAPWSVTDTVAAASLVDLGGGTYRLDAPNAPTDQYVRIIPGDGTLTAAPNRVYPPAPADPATFTVEVDTVDGGMGIVAGLEFSTMPKTDLVGAGVKTATGKKATVTDAAGHASLTLPADAGLFVLRLGRGSVEIDTAGRAGTVVNFADLLP